MTTKGKWLCAGVVGMTVGLSGCAGLDWFAGHKETRKEVASRIDLNGDGIVNADEVAKSGLDANHDGALQLSELDAGKQETEGSNIPAILVTILGLFVPVAGKLGQVVLSQRSHLRAVIAGIEDVKDTMKGLPSQAPQTLNWDAVKELMRSAAEKHTNPIALNTLVQKVTSSL